MTHLRFVSGWYSVWGIAAAVLLAGLAWWLYRRELRRYDGGSASWWLPALRSGAIFLIVLTLAEPVLETRQHEGQPGSILVLLDGSQSMAVADAGETAAEPRIERAIHSLINPRNGILGELADEFEISVRRFANEPAPGDQSAIRLWESNLSQTQELPATAQTWLPAAWGRSTPLGDALRQVATIENDTDTQVRPVVVLMTDGQSNAGVSPITAIESLAPHTPIFVVGYGSVEEPTDLSLALVQLPQRVYRTDMLRGSLVIADRLPPGTPFKAEIVHGEKVVWVQDFVAEGASRRELNFNLAVAPLFDAETERLPEGAVYATLPLSLQARLSTGASEANRENNHREFHVAVASQKSRVLLIDGRSRWETRYLRNVFDRDPAWEIDTVLGDHLQGEEVGLPRSRDELFKYNLIILGDADARFWQPEQLSWLSDFVERGGGLICVDGARGHLRDPAYAPLQKLLPIRWRNHTADASTSQTVWQAELAVAARNVEALHLATGETQDNAELWLQLPNLHYVSPVEPLAGGEVLVFAVNESDRQPLVVTRRFGAGRVLFMATDETWRWRYKVADTIHQRFWNQVARWCMRVPMSVQGEYVSLDTGAASVDLGQNVELRCSLRELDGSPAEDRAVTAIVQREGQVVARVPLSKNVDLPGFYSSQLGPLPAGDYQVRIEAPGYAQQALEIESKFSVIAPDSQEMLRIGRNQPLLEQIAHQSGGEYVDESEIEQLVDLLRPLSGGRILQSATIIWQSYWWFVSAVLLLVAEWILRKRVGLI